MIQLVVFCLCLFHLSIQKAEEPEGYLVSPSQFGPMHRVGDAGIVLGAQTVGAYLEWHYVVHHEVHVLVAFVHQMVFPHGVDKECVKYVLLFHPDGVDGVHQVRIVHHDGGRFLGIFFPAWIYHVDKPRVRQAFDVVHHRGARGLYVSGQLADVGRLRPVYGQEVEQLLDFGEILQLDLLDEQDVHLHHHVHGFQEVFREIAFLQEEGVEAVVQIVLEVIQRARFREDAPRYPFVALHDFVQRVGVELHACLQVEVFAEREAAQVVALHDVAQLRVLFLESHDGRTGENDFQVGKEVVAAAQFVTPVRMLEHLVNEQHFAASLLEFGSKFHDAVAGEEEVVHVDKEAGTIRAEFLPGVLQQESCLAHTTGALDADEPVAPVDLVHEVAAYGSIGVLYEIGVCPVE